MTSLTDTRARLDRKTTRDGETQQAPRTRYVPLLHRVAAINALLVAVAVTVTIIVLAPGKVSGLAVDEELAVVVAAVAVVVLVNVYLLRRVVAPLQALTAFARQVDLDQLRQRMPGAEPTSEAGELALTFNEMLARLESERRESTERVLSAQEDERLRIAQELHDQVGQDLTAVLLSLSRISLQAPQGMRQEVEAIQDQVRTSLEEVRRIAVELRPEALDDLGLPSALIVLAERFSQHLGLEVASDIADDLPSLSAEIELVVYRVAQEALTNVARHSASARAELALEHRDGRLILTVRDYGLGLPHNKTAGAGIRGMRERAALIGATLELKSNEAGRGTEVQLALPIEVQT
jgi:two-component system, NarL family, sensor histidine kinase UhpB